MKDTKKKLLSVAMGVTMMFGCVCSRPAYVYSEDAQVNQSVETENKTSDFKTSGRIWIAGDSIAADHGYENENNYARFVHGWGEMIGNYLTEDAQVFNQAISGQTAKFFTEESNYQEIMDGIGEGDFLLIQFGHNDYKSAGTTHWELPTDTEGSYRWYLKNYYIDPALKAGAMPVLCTSVVQCRVNPEFRVIDDNQAQNLFARSMRILYEEYRQQGIEIGFIDTYSLTQTYLNSCLGNMSYYYAEKYDNGNKASTSVDRVHFSEAGADMTANMIAQNLMLMYEDFNRFSKTETVEGGTGTKEDPYLISTWCQLYQILQDDERNTPDVYYKLTNDLYPTLQQQEWKTVFRANLDGDNYTIHNVVGASLMSFFDENYGTISNLNLDYKLNHIVTKKQVSFVKDNYGTIRNCKNQGNVVYRYFEPSDNSPWNIGAFAGANHEGAVIDNCANRMKTEVVGRVPEVYFGGIAGRNLGTISNCNNTAELMVDTFEYDTDKKAPIYPQVICCSGGIAGIIDKETSKIEGCSSTKTPTTLTSLESAVKLQMIGELIAVSEDDLQVMIEEKKASGNQSVITGPGVSEEPMASGQPLGSQNPEESQQPSQVKKGDLDEDKQITLQDAQLALKIALNIEKPQGNQLQVADLNGDGKAALDEVQEILKAALKITDSL